MKARGHQEFIFIVPFLFSTNFNLTNELEGTSVLSPVCLYVREGL